MANPAQSRVGRYRAAWLEKDMAWARLLHRGSIFPRLVRTLGVVSVLGDGTLWGVIATLMWVLGGPSGEVCAVAMGGLAAFNVTLYALLKRYTGRPRPYMQCPDIRACIRALDEFSFPSGHTLHAVAFTTVIQFFHPLLGAVLWVFTFLVAMSRIVLGLHYPSDVLAAIVIGATTAGGTISILLYLGF